MYSLHLSYTITLPCKTITMKITIFHGNFLGNTRILITSGQRTLLIFCEPTILLNLYKQQITTEPHKQRLGCHLIPPAENSLALPLKFLLI